MDFDGSFFQGLCFFTLGILCLVGFVSFCLNYYFKSKAYQYYFVYIVSTILFVVSTYFKYKKIHELSPNFQSFCLMSYDILNVVVFYFHTLFIYKSIVLIQKKQSNLNWVLYAYTAIVVVRVFIAIVNPALMNNNPILFNISRVLVLGISLVVFIFLFKQIANHYFRVLFWASSFLIISVLVSIFDVYLHNGNTTLLGIIAVFTGVTFDNVCFVAAFTYQIITKVRENEATEIKHKEQLSTVQLEMKQQTMQHIGREIHDNVGQKLTLASLYTQQLAIENQSASIQSTIENIGAIINQSLAELRQLSKSLSCNVIDSNNLQELLLIECKRFNELKKCKISFIATASIPDLAYQTKSVLLRISQEFIQNSIRHSQCENINIVLNYNNDRLNLSLKDDGKGFESTKNSCTGTGLIHMKKRAKIIGAIYNLESVKDFGTKLTLEMVI